MRTKHKVIPVIFVLLLSLFFYSCKEEKEPEVMPDIPSIPEVTSVNDAPPPPRVTTRPVNYYITPINETLPSLPFTTTAHREHLQDPLIFKPLPDGGITSGSSAVVGSDICTFFPIESISPSTNPDTLPKGEIIPLGTIISLEEKFTGSYDGTDMFSFEDNWNYFYRTVWNGKKGLVFGADLYGIGKSLEENRVSSLLYKSEGAFPDFHPVSGYSKISPAIQAEMEKNGVAFQNVHKNEYYLSFETPDDMISLYMDLVKEKTTPVFVTTDLAAHANHLVFDRLLQYLEEDYFYPQARRLTAAYINAIEEKKDGIPEDVYNKSLRYFQTAQALLDLAPRKTDNTEYGGTAFLYEDVSAADVLKDYPPEVREEVEKIQAAQGIGYSSIFKFDDEPSFTMEEDYSQYKPRGHYTKNGILGAYFKAIMWFGRINFILGGDDFVSPDYTQSTQTEAVQLAPIALFITDITNSSPELKTSWQALFDPITELIGASDDISFYELIPLWNSIKGTGFVQWAGDINNVTAFTTEQYKQLPKPAISGFSVMEGPSMENFAPPVGWRLLGQRYTLDSHIHQTVSSPRFPERYMVSGLDIMRALGSNTAGQFLRNNNEGYLDLLEDTLEEIHESLAGQKDSFWLSTYYTNILLQIRTQALFENGAGFYFTESPNWNLKSMNAAHGTWAELRHDTILYVKQVYAERAGGGDIEPTFRTKPLPSPVHYIEPNVPFWITSALGIEKMFDVLLKYDYLDNRTAQALTALHGIFVRAAAVSRDEADNKLISGNNVTWISKIPAELANIVMTHVLGGYVEDKDSLKMALVADVFTNTETGLVLEVAVGIPYRLFVPLNDKQGGKRVAMGYGFSYYEFPHPMQDRLTNEQWKETVYADKPDMNGYLPFWMKGRVMPGK